MVLQRAQFSRGDENAPLHGRSAKDLAHSCSNDSSRWQTTVMWQYLYQQYHVAVDRKQT